MITHNTNNSQDKLLTKIAAIGTTTSPNAYKQSNFIKIFSIKKQTIKSFYLNCWIERRYLTTALEEKLYRVSPRIIGETNEVK